MNINLTQYGELILAVIICWFYLVTYCAHKLANRKTNRPMLFSVIGFITAIIPPLALAYLLMLYVLKDVSTRSSSFR
jgi:uncharacterized membrane protein YccC